MLIDWIDSRWGANRRTAAEGPSSKYTVLKPKYSNVNKPLASSLSPFKYKHHGYQIYSYCGGCMRLFRLLLWRDRFRYKAQTIQNVHKFLLNLQKHRGGMYLNTFTQFLYFGNTFEVLVLLLHYISDTNTLFTARFYFKIKLQNSDWIKWRTLNGYFYMYCPFT